jgi:hypothetical protein
VKASVAGVPLPAPCLPKNHCGKCPCHKVHGRLTPIVNSNQHMQQSMVRHEPQAHSEQQLQDLQQVPSCTSIAAMMCSPFPSAFWSPLFPCSSQRDMEKQHPGRRLAPDPFVLGHANGKGASQGTSEQVLA